MNEKTIDKIKGGKRDGAGRKPTDNPKLPVTVYIEKLLIEKNGGKPELSKRIYDMVACNFSVNPILERVAENKNRVLEERECIKKPEYSNTGAIPLTTAESTENIFTETKEDKIAKLRGELALVTGAGSLSGQRRAFLKKQIEFLQKQ